MQTREFLFRTQLDAEALEAWVEAGWLIPHRAGAAREFNEVDLARARLIRDLKQDLGVNEDGIPVILELVDQVHGLRRLLRELCLTIQAQPEVSRTRIATEFRAVREAITPDQT
jgi:chaperone modulatory protein CbpM